MPQVTIRRPFGEPDLGDQLGSNDENRDLGLIDGDLSSILGLSVVLALVD
jgi:hypothetical protein